MVINISFINDPDELIFIDYEEKDIFERRREQVEKANKTYKEILSLYSMLSDDLHKKHNNKLRNEIIISLKEKHDLSARQMEEVTGINRGTVLKILNDNKTL